MRAYHRSALTLAFKLYIRFHEVSASDSCKGVGPTIRDTIVAITDTAEISSRYVTLTGRGGAGNAPLAPVKTIVAPFNVSGLVPPVPYSIYTKQDWCQTSIWTEQVKGAYEGDMTTMPTCATTGLYKPILFLPSEILLQMKPLWADCTGDVRGVRTQRSMIGHRRQL